MPQLIDALSDIRFSRTVDFHPRSDEPELNFRYHVLTVGDCALQILERLAGRKFLKQPDRFMSESPILVAGVKRAAAQWNEELQSNLKQKGERQVLFDAVQKADWESVRLTDLLLAKYPDQAFKVLAGAARRNRQDSSTTVRRIDRASRRGGEHRLSRRGTQNLAAAQRTRHYRGYSVNARAWGGHGRDAGSLATLARESLRGRVARRCRVLFGGLGRRSGGQGAGNRPETAQPACAFGGHLCVRALMPAGQ